MRYIELVLRNGNHRTCSTWWLIYKTVERIEANVHFIYLANSNLLFIGIWVRFISMMYPEIANLNYNLNNRMWW